MAFSPCQPIGIFLNDLWIIVISWLRKGPLWEAVPTAGTSLAERFTMSSNAEENPDQAPAEMTDLWRKAVVFAARAHRGMRSEKLDAPYIAHPVRVAMSVMLDFGCDDPRVLAAALLHDVVEKSEYGLEEISAVFGGAVASWVLALSKAPGENKDSYWKGVGKSPWQVRLIKSADALDHLDCPPEERAARIKSVEKAILLLGTDEPPVRQARGILQDVVRQTPSPSDRQ